MYSFSYPGASIDEILSHHQNLLRELGEEAAVSLTAEQLPEEVSDVRRRTQAFSIARGALKPMTRAEVERLTVVKAELVLEPSDNPFRSPLADEAELAPRPRSAWRAVLIGAFYGFALGLLVRLWFGAGAEPPPNATLWEKWLLILRFFGWQALPALVGAFLGWWVWRRAQQRAAVSITSN
jgi:ADP-ribose pyrophosphatase YjhB (NUDIX family)